MVTADGMNLVNDSVAFKAEVAMTSARIANESARYGVIVVVNSLGGSLK
jgi:hypothetical protein